MEKLRHSILFILCIIGQTSLWGQITAYKADSISYVQYFKSDIKGLKKTVKQAQAAEVGFYYLYMRPAVLLYKKQNYEAAARYFAKAQRYYPTDTLVAEYLYYSHLNQGRVFDAEAATRWFSDGQLVRNNVNTKLFTGIALEGGYAQSNNNSVNATLPTVPLSIYSEATRLNTYYFGTAGVGLRLGKRIRLNAAATYLGLNNTRGIRIPTLDTTHNFTTTQYQAYLGGDVFLGKGWTVSAGGHYIVYNYTTFNATLVNPTPPPTYTFNNQSTNASNYVAALALTKRLPYLGVTLSGSYANLNNSNQYQGNLTLAYYPLGNTKLYGLSTLTYQQDGDSTRYLLNQRIGTSLGRFTAEAHYTFGRIHNLIEGNGYLVFNLPDYITLRTGVDVGYKLSKSLSLVARYQYQQREGGYVYYPNPQQNLRQQTFFDLHLLTFGITITP